MNSAAFAGALLRMVRLEKNWSQETLCQGICTVSYLSKIEQGKAQANESLLRDLFEKMDIAWQSTPRKEGEQLCEMLYDVVFSDDVNELERYKEEGLLRQESAALDSNYLDYLILRAYCCMDTGLIPQPIRPLLDDRQKSLLYLLEDQPERAMQCNPCALTVQCAGAKAYTQGNYTLALELLQRAYDMASQNGYARIMMCCQAYMANCYSDLRNVPDMLQHSQIAKRLARILGDMEMLETIDYNIASTQIECGEYESGYAHFASIQEPTALQLHKLAICCEMLGKREEALCALDTARNLAVDLERDMCDIVRYRLENPNYLHDSGYGELLLNTFKTLKRERSVGYARFHLSRVEEWCTANRQYRTIYEIMCDFL